MPQAEIDGGLREVAPQAPTGLGEVMPVLRVEVEAAASVRFT